VLVAEHLRGAAPFQCGAYPVGADESLGVGEAGGEPDLVQVLAQLGVAGAPLQHDAVGVGEDEAHRFPGQLVGDVGHDRRRGPDER
jgi:hypothetical protein